MKRNSTKITPIICGLLTLTLFFSWTLSVFAAPPPPADTGSQVNLTVNGCNDNGICEPNLGENDMTCSIDCPTSTPPTSTPPTVPSSSVSSPAGVVSGGGSVSTPPSTLEISSIVLQQSGNSIVVTWTTTSTSLSVFSWGKLSDEEAGSISEVTYTLHHSETIVDVQPGTRYYVEIRAKDLYGGSLDYVGEFTTASLPNSNPLPNVSDTAIHFENNSFLLSWTNPNDSRVTGIRIVRSPYGYPTDPLDGKVIYQGDGHYAIDSGITTNTQYYYTIFSYDSAGDYSSGAVLTGRWVASGAAATASSSSMAMQTGALSSMPFVFSQNNSPINYSGSVVGVDGTALLTISLASTTPGVGTNGGIVSVTTGAGVENYLFRLNASDIAFETEIDFSHLSAGNYPFSITLGQASGSSTIFYGTFDVYQPGATSHRVSFSVADTSILIVLFAIFLILVAIVISLIYRLL